LLLSSVSNMTSKSLPAVKNKDLCSWVFDEAEEGKLKCNIYGANGIENGGSGFTNLLSHINKSTCFGSLSNVLASYREAEKGRQKEGFNKLHSTTTSKDALKFFGWIHLINLCCRPISTCTNKIIRQFITLLPPDEKR
jgi:hypothetical protein